MEMPDLCRPEPSENVCFDFIQGKWRSLITGSFVQIRKASQEWKEREGEKRRKKGLWISDRWGGFIWLQRLLESFRPSFGTLFCSFSSLSEARDVPQSLLEAYPCCYKHKDPNNATLSQSGATCQWLFFPILYIFPLFPSFLAFIFIGRLVLYPMPSGPVQKKLGFFFPFSFVKRCVLGISMDTHIRGRVNPAFRLCSFGIFLCVGSEWCGTLWLNHAATNLIKEANLVFMCKSSCSLGMWKNMQVKVLPPIMVDPYW